MWIYGSGVVSKLFVCSLPKCNSKRPSLNGRLEYVISCSTICRSRIYHLQPPLVRYRDMSTQRCKYLAPHCCLRLFTYVPCYVGYMLCCANFVSFGKIPNRHHTTRHCDTNNEAIDLRSFTFASYTHFYSNNYSEWVLL